MMGEVTLMNMYVIMLKTDAKYQLLKRLFSDYPQLKTGFKLKEILKLSLLPLNDRRILKEMFGGSYSQVLTPGLNFEYRDDKWEVQEIDTQRVFHQNITKVLNHALKEGKYAIRSLVSTKDIELVEFLMRKEHEVFQEDFKGVEVDGIPINQESLEFVSGGLQEKMGEESRFDYDLVKAFLESLHDYEEILIRREFG
jgi:hypothetical protein